MREQLLLLLTYVQARTATPVLLVDEHLAGKVVPEKLDALGDIGVQ